ncbi:MAG: T9SS type A sorting domain-containing protein [Bacteroidetes bacterium]|nr:T9SS type A sorting domain-containing protein [Bacteroidota bacterium]
MKQIFTSLLMTLLISIGLSAQTITMSPNPPTAGQDINIILSGSGEGGPTVTIDFENQDNGDAGTVVLTPGALGTYTGTLTTNNSAVPTADGVLDMQLGDLVGVGYPTGSPTVTDFGTALPVELSSFTGRYSPKGMAVLNWTTESELNNDFFTVERSFDGRDFEAIEKIAGAGTSLESQTYQFLDHTAVSLAKSNTVYYRLKQTDFDGAFSHSDLISVELDRKDVLEVNSFVNESTGIDLYYSVPQNSKVVVSIFTTSGQQIKKETYNVEAGNNLYQADISNLPSGMYILSLQNGESILNQKFVK